MWPWQKGRAVGSSFIGPGIRIRGDVESEGDLTICGRVEGDISHDGRLVIGPGAQVASNIRALQVQIAGEVRGNIHVQDTVELLGTARVYGDVWCAALQVENGAVFFGTNHMAGAAELLPAPAPVSATAPAAAPAAATAAATAAVPAPAPVSVAPVTPVAPSASEPVAAPLAILLRPVGIEEKAVLCGSARPAPEAEAKVEAPSVAVPAAIVRPVAAAAEPPRLGGAEAPAFYGGFSGSLRSEAS